jgi:hypothetical protein
VDEKVEAWSAGERICREWDWRGRRKRFGIGLVKF